MLQLNTIPVLAAAPANGSEDLSVSNLLDPVGTLNTSGVIGNPALGGVGIHYHPARRSNAEKGLLVTPYSSSDQRQPYSLEVICGKTNCLII